MSLFAKVKKKETAPETVQSGKAAVPEGDCEIKILGSGCAKCNALEAAAEKALKQLGREVKIDHVRDFAQIAAYGVMTTPALVLNGRVLTSGRVLSAEEIAELIKANAI